MHSPTAAPSFPPPPPPLQILLAADSEVALWHLSGRQRLRKQFALAARAARVAVVWPDTVAACADTAPLLLIRGDYVYTQKLIAALAKNRREFVLRADADGAALALYLAPDAPGPDAAPRRPRAAAPAEFRRGVVPADVPSLAVADFAPPYDDALRKHEPAAAYPVSAERQARLERFLFDSAYKGVTDFVTRFLWPKPAAVATRFCARRGVTPNQVTMLSLLLVVAAGLLFQHGWFLSGLLAGWLMTFLDTVDGKLARVTVNASAAGHALDHGMDIIHPPLWYLAWALGLIDAGLLAAEAFAPLTTCMLLAYIGGRLVEGVFEWRAPISIFTWRRFDSLHRLITARRNPNLVLLSGFTAAGLPAHGLFAVVVWHGICTLVLLWRLGQAAWHVRKGGELESWLAKPRPADAEMDWVERLFTRAPSPP